MARAKQTFGKREKEKDRLRKKVQKQERKEERKKNSLKGMGLDAMVVDQLQPKSRSSITADNKEVVPPINSPSGSGRRKGRVSYYNEQKGYGFVRDSQFKDNIIFQIKELSCVVKLNDLVSFVKEKNPGGVFASGIVPA